jgi:hypothetical protein
MLGSASASGSRPAQPTPDAPVPQPTPATPVAVVAPRVAVIGDSLVFQTLAEEADALTSRGFDPEIYARPGVPLSDAWVQAYVATVARERALSTVVIATASNDNVEVAHRAAAVGVGAATAEYAARLEAAIDQLAGRCVVVVDVRADSAGIYSPGLASGTNAAIASVVARHGSGAVEVDWAAISHPHRADWFITDELHFADVDSGADRHQAGADAYAAAIADGASRCTRG